MKALQKAQTETIVACPQCRSIQIEKRGLRSTKIGLSQRWRCKECGQYFGDQSVNQYREERAKIILALYSQTLSLAQVRELWWQQSREILTRQAIMGILDKYFPLEYAILSRKSMEEWKTKRLRAQTIGVTNEKRMTSHRYQLALWKARKYFSVPSNSLRLEKRDIKLIRHFRGESPKSFEYRFSIGNSPDLEKKVGETQIALKDLLALAEPQISPARKCDGCGSPIVTHSVFLDGDFVCRKCGLVAQEIGIKLPQLPRMTMRRLEELKNQELVYIERPKYEGTKLQRLTNRPFNRLHRGKGTFATNKPHATFASPEQVLRTKGLIRFAERRTSMGAKPKLSLDRKPHRNRNVKRHMPQHNHVVIDHKRDKGYRNRHVTLGVKSYELLPY